jgi:hypothetical protein
VQKYKYEARRKGLFSFDRDVNHCEGEPAPSICAGQSSLAGVSVDASCYFCSISAGRPSSIVAPCLGHLRAFPRALTKHLRGAAEAWPRHCRRAAPPDGRRVRLYLSLPPASGRNCSNDGSQDAGAHALLFEIARGHARGLRTASSSTVS